MQLSLGSKMNLHSCSKICASFSMAVSLFAALSRVKWPIYQGMNNGTLDESNTYPSHGNFDTINEVEHGHCKLFTCVPGREIMESDQCSLQGKCTCFSILSDPMCHHGKI